MSTSAESGFGFSGRHALIAGLGIFGGIGLTAFRPMIGLELGIVALIAAVALFLLRGLPRWTAWLVAGFAIGVAGYYLLGLFSLLNPIPGSNSGGS